MYSETDSKKKIDPNLIEIINLLDKNKSILKLSCDSPLLKGNPDNSSLKKRVNKIFKEDNSRIGIVL